MVFSSTAFLFVFLPVSSLVYYLIGGVLTRNMTVKNGILLAASLCFYAWGEPVALVVMLISILFNYIVGRDMDYAFRLRSRARARAALVIGVVFNLALLGFFKYAGFAAENLNAWFGWRLPLPQLPLPIGISFYTFQILSYLIDLYREKIRVQKNLLDFALYITLFPQLIAGPIVKYRDVEPQLRGRRECLPQYAGGLMRFTVGLSKKLLLANTLGAVFAAVQARGAAETTMLGAWTGIACYTLQIYFDFSGYSDMAIGLGAMFGFRFNENFNYPYAAVSVTDFWRRWHMSLSSWFKQYVYIPLGGNRRKTPRVIFNLLTVWLLTGLWHGASWNFILWGLYYGLLLTAEKYLLGGLLKRLPRLLRRLLTLLAAAVGWVLFSAPTLGEAWAYLRAMCGANGLSDGDALYRLTSALPLLACGVLAATPLCRAVARRCRPRTAALLQSALCPVLLILCIVCVISDSYNPFLYFRF